MPFGTISTLDTLKATQQSVIQYGEDRAWEQISLTLDAHNRIMREIIGDIAEVADGDRGRLRRYGTAGAMTMQALDQNGRPYAQKVTAGSTMGFPLRLYGVSVQWTRKAFLVMPAAELAAQFEAAQDADALNMTSILKTALFDSTNYTFSDVLVDDVDLNVKALVNADGAQIPVGPNGETYSGSHTHYLATAALTAADLTGLIETVVEHHNVGSPVVLINRAQEAAVRALTGFTAYVDARIIPATTANVGRTSLDMNNLYNRAIGVFGAAEVWVKPWVPATYMFCYVKGAPKPVVLRERTSGSGNFVIAAEDEAHPLRCRSMEREIGAGVWTRTNGAVLYTGGGAYVVPTGL